MVDTFCVDDGEVVEQEVRVAELERTGLEAGAAPEHDPKRGLQPALQWAFVLPHRLYWLGNLVKDLVVW